MCQPFDTLRWVATLGLGWGQKQRSAPEGALCSTLVVQEAGQRLLSLMMSHLPSIFFQVSTFRDLSLKVLEV